MEKNSWTIESHVGSLSLSAVANQKNYYSSYISRSGLDSGFLLHLMLRDTTPFINNKT